MNPDGELLPPGLLVAWYGDDLTGSAAVLEVLTFAGLEAVLFFDAPTPDRLARFPEVRAIGIAGVARSQGVEWMERELPPLFRALRALAAPVTQYKICSTFDSSPRVGSIGKAIELGAPILGGPWLPLLPAAPPMRRYQAFGNLFASAGDVGHRLDRHPTMSRHPVTPMGEADVRVHLAQQTVLPVGLVDLVAMKNGSASRHLADAIRHGTRIVALDVIDDETMLEAGRLMWEHRGDRLFAIGSQGVEYALIAYWKKIGMLPVATRAFRAGAVERLLVVSGSCSPLTADQIGWAERSGFTRVALDAALAVDQRSWQAETERAATEALRLIGDGHDPIVTTVNGPDDRAIMSVRAAAQARSMDENEVNKRIGDGLGRIVNRVVRTARLSRAVIAGGDTSGHATRALDVFALTALARTVPGAALCKAHSDDPALSGLELALKGGQMGSIDYFGLIKEGETR